MDGVSSAYVRCAVSDGLTIGCSAPLCVTVSLEAETAAALLKEEMENVVSLSVPLTADAHWGRNWLEAKG
mgnify:CR=1 FL=1